jgi:hypothetical protein
MKPLLCRVTPRVRSAQEWDPPAAPAGPCSSLAPHTCTRHPRGLPGGAHSVLTLLDSLHLPRKHRSVLTLLVLLSLSCKYRYGITDWVQAAYSQHSWTSFACSRSAVVADLSDLQCLPSHGNSDVGRAQQSHQQPCKQDPNKPAHAPLATAPADLAKSMAGLGVSSSGGMRPGVKARIQVPRLNGERMGVLATRSPHRPCPIGLSVAQVCLVPVDSPSSPPGTGSPCMQPHSLPAKATCCAHTLPHYHLLAKV